MNRYLKKLAVTVFPAMAMLAGCTQIDLVGRASITSFEELLKSDRLGVTDSGDSWTLLSPGNESFTFSKDFAAPRAGFTITIDADAYLSAGLDPAKLVPSDRYRFDSDAKTLTLLFEVSGTKAEAPAGGSPLESFEGIVRYQRNLIGYHEELDHYGIALGDGNMLEWAKDLPKNDKDLVFVLNPQPLVDAGTDPAKIQGWVYGQVTVRDSSGKNIKVDKFLKPYDLR